MKNSLIYVSLLAITFLIVSCDNEDSLDCLKKTGEVIEKEVILESFYMIRAMDEVDIYISNSEDQLVTVRAGKNLIPEIKFSVDEGILTLENHNSCNWHRSPGNPEVFIASNTLMKIEIFDFVNIYTIDTLKGDRFDLYSNGTGNFEMMMQVESMKVETANISNFTLAGQAEFLELNLFNDSRFLSRDLIVNEVKIMHQGSNLVELYPIFSLTGTLERTGNIRYYHKPEIMDVKITGTGEVQDYSGR